VVFDCIVNQDKLKCFIISAYYCLLANCIIISLNNKQN